MINTYKNDPLYPDRYDRQTGWKKILPIHGRPLQTSELIEMQSILQDNLKQGLDVLFKNGTVLSGLRVVESNRTDAQLNIYVSPGQIYIEGAVLEVPEANLVCPVTDIHSVGVLLTEEIITELEDPNLRNPNTGGALYGEEGAARLTWQAKVVLNTPDTYTITKVEKGQIIQPEILPPFGLDQAISQYIYNRNGNFSVSGYNLSSVDISKAAVADNRTYTLLRTQAEEANTKAEQALVDSTGALELVDALQARLNAAVLVQGQTPTTANTIQVNALQTQLQQAQQAADRNARDYVDKQNKSNLVSEQLDKAEASLVDKIGIQVSPGVAYVKGRAIIKNTPTLVEVPKELATAQVDAVRIDLNDSSSSPSSIRTLTSAVPVGSLMGTLLFEFRNLRYEYEPVVNSINVAYNLTSNPASVDTLEELLDNLVNVFNSTGIIPSYVQFTSIGTTPALLPTTARSVLRSNLTVTRVSTGQLIFRSTGLSSDEDISIRIIPPANLTVDVPIASLAGPATNNQFQLGFRPVVGIQAISAEVEQDYFAVARGAVPGTRDRLGDDSILRITKVIQGTTTFVEGRDYRLINQSEIDWSGGLNEPAVNTTYFASYIFSRPLAEGTDFTLINSTISFKQVKPISFTVSYTYGLKQAGAIIIDSDATLRAVLSTPSAEPLPPAVGEDSLIVGTFILTKDEVTVSDAQAKRFTVSQLHALSEQVEDNSRQIELLKSKINAPSSGSEIQELLLDLSTINPESKATISPATQSFTDSYYHLDSPLVRQSGGTLVNGVVTLPFVYEEWIKQDRITRSRSVATQQNGIGRMYLSFNQLFLNKLPDLNLSPCDPIRALINLPEGPTYNSISRIVTANFVRAAQLIADGIKEGIPFTGASARLNSFNKYISDNAKAISTTVDISLENLVPNNHYRLYFQSVAREISAIGSSALPPGNFRPISGTKLSVYDLNGFQAKVDGTAELRFRLPEGVATGSHKLEVKPVSLSTGYASNTLAVYNNLLDQVNLSATSSWTSVRPDTSANEQTAAYLSATHPTLKHRYPSLTQTFNSSTYAIAARVKLKLRSVSTANSAYMRVLLSDYADPYSVKQRGNTTSYGSSNNGSVETAFNLFRPLLLEPDKCYSLGVEANRSGFQLFTANPFKPDLITSNTIGEQLYFQGDLLESNDGLTLDSVDPEDLYFVIDRAKFVALNDYVPLGTYVINGLNIRYFCINSRDVVPPGTTLTYQYSTGSQWIDVNAHQVVCLPAPASSIQLRAALSSTTDRLSPIVNLNGASVSLYSTLPSTVLSPILTFPAYTRFDLTFQYIRPAGSSITSFYSATRGTIAENAQVSTEWIPLSNPLSNRIVDNSINMYEITYRLSGLSPEYIPSVLRTFARYRIVISSTNQPALVRNVKVSVA